MGGRRAGQGALSVEKNEKITRTAPILKFLSAMDIEKFKYGGGLAKGREEGVIRSEK